MSQLPQSTDPTLTKWKAILDPVLANPVIQGNLLKNIALIQGDTAVNHLLQRMPQGWMIADQNAVSDIYRTSWDNLVLVLNATQPVTISLWVF